MNANRWLLPEGIDEALPEKARQLESLRRAMLDLFNSWGYELVMPPFVEYLDSLLTGTGHDLDLQTFKLTDQLSGRMLGIRADMTPQVARIEAHHIRSQAPTRLCYLGTVLHTRPAGFAGSRSLLQVGAELYGHSGRESDVEIIRLMLETLSKAGIEQPYLDLGHVGIYRGLVEQAGLSVDQEAELFDALQRKAKPELEDLFSRWSLDRKLADMLMALSDLHGGDEVFAEARQALAGASQGVRASLENVEAIAAALRQQVPGINLHFDLSELRGFNYHTGVVFAAYVPGQGQAIALGGRYDGIGEAFGQARPATGFSTDLRILAEFAGNGRDTPGGILAPADSDEALMTTITRLRQQGERVISNLPGQQGSAADMGCDRQLVKSNSGWVVEPV